MDESAEAIANLFNKALVSVIGQLVIKADLQTAEVVPEMDRLPGRIEAILEGNGMFGANQPGRDTRCARKPCACSIFDFDGRGGGGSRSPMNLKRSAGIYRIKVMESVHKWSRILSESTLSSYGTRENPG